ncbi:MAG: hypothetical protein L6R35_001785 [Caloplaca aegaea]|nr:MAG: hypothetical protein L6R35_001785 [Caloplaca aegaea]
MFSQLLQAVLPYVQAVIEQRPPYIAIGVATSFVFVLYRFVFSTSPKLPLPYYYVKDSVIATLEEAHRDHPDGSFALSLPGQDLAVLAAREIDTIKSLPETDVSIK